MLSIETQQLGKKFQGKWTVDHVNLNVERGIICGFLGPNGSGKTTIMRMLYGLLKPDSGNGSCLGYNILSESEKIKPEVGYMPQTFSLYKKLTVEENLRFIGRLYEIENLEKRIDELLNRFLLYSKKDYLTNALSGGWKQRLALACAIIHKPHMLLLDEPTVGIDPIARHHIWQIIREEVRNGMTVLITTHYMDEAERCQRIVYLSDGKIYTQGSIKEIIEKEHLSTWIVNGKEDFGKIIDLGEIMDLLKASQGVEQILEFGQYLRVSGHDHTNLAKSVNKICGSNYPHYQGDTSLEDVLSYLTSTHGEQNK